LGVEVEVEVEVKSSARDRLLLVVGVEMAGARRDKRDIGFGAISAYNGPGVEVDADLIERP
jgi:hypothetical protein